MNAFKAWINRLKLCLSVIGEYFKVTIKNKKISYYVIFIERPSHFS